MNEAIYRWEESKLIFQFFLSPEVSLDFEYLDSTFIMFFCIANTNIQHLDLTSLSPIFSWNIPVERFMLLMAQKLDHAMVLLISQFGGELGK